MCVLFPIANIINLALYHNPSDIIYNFAEMRLHARDLLTSRALHPFPQIPDSFSINRDFVTPKQTRGRPKTQTTNSVSSQSFDSSPSQATSSSLVKSNDCFIIPSRKVRGWPKKIKSTSVLTKDAIHIPITPITNISFFRFPSISSSLPTKKTKVCSTFQPPLLPTTSKSNVN